MRRRSFLAGAVGLFAGCGSFGSVTGERDAATVTPAPVPSPTAVVDPKRRFAGELCPRFDRRTDQTVCGHTQPRDASLRFTTDRAVAELADDGLVDPLRMTLSWSLEGSLAVFAQSWYLLRQDDEEWTGVATATGDEGVVRLDSGDHVHWLLDTRLHDTGDATVPVDVPLSPGRYAFAVQTVGGRSLLHTESVVLFDVVTADGAETAGA